MLYVIPTPIGNLRDITLRALETLQTVDVVLCEDTRRTHTLLAHFNISKPLVRYNENDPHSVTRCLTLIQEGKNCALVSDCGTPCISDPGYKLVKAARQAGVAVTSLPGPSALTCALAGAGLTGGAFTFLGFLPRKPGKAATLLRDAAAQEHIVIVYESPYRVLKLLALIGSTLGAQTPVVAVRELSKIYEEYITGTVEEVTHKLSSRSKIQGEFVIIIDCFKTHSSDETDTAL